MTGSGVRGRRDASQPAVVLRGPPTRLAATRPLPAEIASIAAKPSGSAAVSILVEGATPERARIHGARRRAVRPELRVRLAPTTPPGRYEGAASIGDRSVPIVVEVEAAPRVRAVPSGFTMTAEPVGSATVELHLANTGNVPIEIPARSSFCLFDGGGIDHAVWAALTADPPQGKGRLEVLLDDLATSHGGLVDVRVRAGAGSIEPGEGRTCSVELRWSDRLRPGRSYTGAWEVAGLQVPFHVETPRVRPADGSAPRTPRRPR